MNVESGLMCGFGRYCRPTGQLLSPINLLRTNVDFLLLATLDSRLAIRFLVWLELSAVFWRLGAGWWDGISSSLLSRSLLSGDSGVGWLSVISTSMATVSSVFIVLKRTVFSGYKQSAIPVSDISNDVSFFSCSQCAW